jgi:hypothetical protein
MKLILAYIPKPLNSNSSNYNQQEYIKKINIIIDEFFKELKQKEEVNEINYDLYYSKINESINQKKLNGPFFLFINILKYIFINRPFNKESILAIKYVKDKYLLKVQIPKNLNTVIKNYIPIITHSSKKLDSEEFLGITDRNERDNNNEFIPIYLSKKYDKKFTEYKISSKNYGLDKFQKKNLFLSKKGGSTTLEKSQIQKAFENVNLHNGNKSSKSIFPSDLSLHKIVNGKTFIYL